MNEDTGSIAAPEQETSENPLATSAFVLSAISAIVYFASSRGIQNFFLFLMDVVEKALQHRGIGF